MHEPGTLAVPGFLLSRAGNRTDEVARLSERASVRQRAREGGGSRPERADAAGGREPLTAHRFVTQGPRRRGPSHIRWGRGALEEDDA